MENKQQQIVWVDRPGLRIPPWCEIQLSNGAVALIDADDYERVSERIWHAHAARGKRYIYASCNIRKAEATRYGVKIEGTIRDRNDQGRLEYTRLTLHQFLLGTRPGYVIDHANGDALDCRRHNLRWATIRGNTANRGKRPDKSSIYIGVSWRGNGKWRAAGTRNGRYAHLGYFLDEADAARAYDGNASREYGQFARLNFQ